MGTKKETTYLDCGTLVRYYGLILTALLYSSNVHNFHSSSTAYPGAAA